MLTIDWLHVLHDSSVLAVADEFLGFRDSHRLKACCTWLRHFQGRKRCITSEADLKFIPLHVTTVYLKFDKLFSLNTQASGATSLPRHLTSLENFHCFEFVLNDWARIKRLGVLYYENEQAKRDNKLTYDNVYPWRMEHLHNTVFNELFPPNLTYLRFSNKFNLAVPKGLLPRSLTRLEFALNYKPSINDLPPCLDTLVLPFRSGAVQFCTMPKTLRRLTIHLNGFTPSYKFDGVRHLTLMTRRSDVTLPSHPVWKEHIGPIPLSVQTITILATMRTHEQLVERGFKMVKSRRELSVYVRLKKRPKKKEKQKGKKRGPSEDLENPKAVKKVNA